MSEDRLAALERRIARLESRLHTVSPPESPSLGAAATGMLRQAKKEDKLGSVGYIGASRLAAGESLWDRQLSLAELLSADWTPVAHILETLGSRPRLALLAALLRQGRRTSNDLQESLAGDGEQTTSGQLYHHLRALQSARLITQRRRGEYELAPQAMPQVLSILAAAFDLANDPPLGPPIDLPGME
ncbi:helix-turn-helix domain-containing protein [Nonomuraea aurantiaca]|jgi:DNA-binding HxlR family transcriptional regulator|uniref:helix-turn-helix domain-containing protein n=1 Tax=Nonomuraea aurantiaca TaxID=2878562 RepID=UPI001CD97F54|nr:helix-turn-helix domain-containing protein [Nonomuraea aurantiaca]MCA2228857.1 helix-turn-helix domain-containing protein [Nonomuraea aurantiaca]